MMKSIALTVATVLATTSAAFAQNPPQGTGQPAAPGAARPATPAPAPATPAPGAATPAPNQGATAATPTPSGSFARNTAATAAAAREAFAAKVKQREADCRAKGPLYVWKPPHAIGDAAPGGGFYTSPSGGSCRSVASKRVLEQLRAAGMLRQ